MKSHLLTSEDYLLLITSRSISEVVEFLMKKDYRDKLSRLPFVEIDEYKLEELFNEMLSDRFYFLVDISHGVIKEVLKSFSRRLEIENLKRIMRTKHGGEEIRSEELLPIPERYLFINFPALIKADSVEKVVKLLRETDYFKLIDYLDLYRRYKMLIILESALNKIYFQMLWRVIEDIPDKKDVKDLIGLEIDLTNILNIIALVSSRIDPYVIEKTIVNIYYRIAERKLRQLAHSTISDAAEILATTPYYGVAGEILNLISRGETAKIESVIRRKIFRRAVETLINKSMSLAYVFAYLYLSEIENRNLTTIVFGKRLGLDGKKIRDLVSV